MDRTNKCIVKGCPRFSTTHGIFCQDHWQEHYQAYEAEKRNGQSVKCKPRYRTIKVALLEHERQALIAMGWRLLWVDQDGSTRWEYEGKAVGAAR